MSNDPIQREIARLEVEAREGEREIEELVGSSPYQRKPRSEMFRIRSAARGLAEATGYAVFEPEYWWKRHKEWAVRTQALPGLEKLRHTQQLGWNRTVAERPPEVAKLVKVLGGMK